MSERPAKRQRTSTASMVDSKLDITGKVVKIKVTRDPHTQVFHVHENVLKKGSSPFFKARLRKEWIALSGDDDEPVIVDGHHPQIFEIYVKWLYTGAFDLKKNGWVGLVFAYVFGDEMLDREFQNSILTSAVKQSASGCIAVPCSHAVNKAYKSLPEGSPLQRFFVHMFAIALLPKVIEESLDERYHHRFLLDIVMAMKKTQAEAREPEMGEVWPVKIEDYLLEDVEVDGGDGGVKNETQDQETVGPSASGARAPTS